MTTHPAITNLIRYFDCDHLPAGLQEISRPCRDLAHDMTHRLPGSPELTAGLRKLLEAKDCFVRAAVEADDDV